MGKPNLRTVISIGAASMRSLSLVAAAVLVLLVPCNAADDTKSAAGWKPLFNGKDLGGWEHVGPGKMVIEDGMIRTEGGMGLLWYTKEKYGNCTIRVVYKTTSQASNSGVFVRIADRPKDEWYAVHHGYEVQICDVQDPYHTTGSIYSLSKATAQPSKPRGEWNTLEITLEGDRVLISLNGVPVNDFDPKGPVPERKKNYEPERGPRPESGYVGLQNHDDYATGTQVYFKEVSVRPLSSAARGGR
jgi:hypothetical protein